MHDHHPNEWIYDFVFNLDLKIKFIKILYQAECGTKID